jgi:hypothetical protein
MIPLFQRAQRLLPTIGISVLAVSIFSIAPAFYYCSSSISQLFLLFFQDKASEVSNDIEQAKLALEFIGSMDCTDDENKRWQQENIVQIISLSANKYSSFFANKLIECSRTPAQKAIADQIYDYSNNVDLVKSFYLDLGNARRLADFGLKNSNTFDLFENAARGLPAEFGQKVDSGSLEMAKKSVNSGNFSLALDYYLKAFEKIEIPN